MDPSATPAHRHAHAGSLGRHRQAPRMRAGDERRGRDLGRVRHAAQHVALEEAHRSDRAPHDVTTGQGFARMVLGRYSGCLG